MNYYIFRHGKTFFSKNDIPYGNQVETAKILPEAIPPLERLAKYLKNIKTDFNVSSTYTRCRQTAEIVEKISGKKFEFDPLLHDWDPRNETVEDTAKRIETFYIQLTTSNLQPKSVCICTHGYPLAMLKSLVVTSTIDLSKINDYPTTGVLLVIKDGKAEEIDFNQKW